jgi:hypothetical protein
VAARHHFLARITAFGETDALDQVQIDRLRDEDVLRGRSDPRDACGQVGGVPLRGRRQAQRACQRGGLFQLFVGRDPPPAQARVGGRRGDPGAGRQVGALPGFARQRAGGGFQRGHVRGRSRHARHMQRRGGELGLGAQHEHRQALEQRLRQILAHQAIELGRVVRAGGGAPHHQGGQQAALGGAVAGQAGGVPGQAGDVLRELAVQEAEGVRAGCGKDQEVVQRRNLRATFRAGGNRRMESVHGGGVIASSKC